jgi:sulfhydrogenase subunit beta (sulfur reductase)
MYIDDIMMKSFENSNLSQLFTTLRKEGYFIIGPTIRDGAIVYDEVNVPSDLPIGWTDEQEKGTYRIKHRDDDSVFGYVVGPHSWKKYLFPPLLRLFSVQRKGKDLEIDQQEHVGSEKMRYAFIGLRSCELHALSIQDKVFINGQFTDPHYAAVRENIFIVAINCTEPGGTCFCTSMNTGPKATTGFDIALTEIIDEHRHFFLVEVGSERGAKVMEKIQHREALNHEVQESKKLLATAATQMGRTLETTDIKELLSANFEHPRWEDVAQRCLSCANCTMVCPTCFCSTVEDVTDLTGDHAERWRKWDSCFNLDFSYIHGGTVRTSVKSRYRQWLTHKLSSWIDQFGTSGCVGCGRCITWCPVSIDITEEVAALRVTSHSSSDNLDKETHHGNT